MSLQAVIFDLDGVITDTAEYHYLAWQKLADEEGFPFGRVENEALRGVSRRESLLLILKGREIPEERLQAMMARKNRYYQEMLGQITPADLLPGVLAVLDELDAAGIPYAIASVSHNARDVLARLDILRRLAVVADGHSVSRQKPAPDLFRFAAARLNVPPGQCLVVEDAAAGVEAALAAGMPVLALGPAERFAAYHVPRRDNLAGARLADLRAFVTPDPLWTVVEEGFDPGRLRHQETLFTIGSGYFCSRGTFEEGYPGELSLTLAHGLYDDAPIFFTELANLPHWLDCRLAVDGQPFRLDQGELLHFQRRLHLQQGLLQREVRWRAPHGAIVDLTFERFISYADEHVGALRVVATAVNQPCQVAVWSGINGHVANDDLLHWRHVAQGSDGNQIWLHSRTRHSGLELLAAARLESSASGPITVQECPGQPTLSLVETLQPGQSLQLDKIVTYHSSRDRDWGLGVGDWLPISHQPSLLSNYHALKANHTAAWRRVWEQADVIIEGDDEAQLAMRFSLFQLQIAAPQHDGRVSIGAKTLSGLGYRGHVFWDNEIFVLPFFTYTQPEIARNLLMYRYHTLPGARRKAATNGYGGAQYAWESADTGDEVTPSYVPDFKGKNLVRIWTGDIEIHITADITYAIWQYWQVTGDNAFLRDYGAEIILEGARFWGERAELEEGEDGRRYALRDVIGPDEYHDHVDNNVFTNRMAQWHLQIALQVLDWLSENAPEKGLALVQQLELSPARLAHWQDVIDHLVIHHDPETGLMTQFDGFFDLKPVEWAVYANRAHSMQQLLGIEGANESQVLKQGDVIMLLCLLRDQYGHQTWQTNWETYVPITDHSYGSSLGPSFHAWAACEMRRPDEAYEHFMRAARADLQDVRGNAGDGIHAASAGGLWQAAVFGFAGLHMQGESYTLQPCLPAHWRRLAFKFYLKGKQQAAEIVAKEVK